MELVASYARNKDHSYPVEDLSSLLTQIVGIERFYIEVDMDKGQYKVSVKGGDPYTIAHAVWMCHFPGWERLGNTTMQVEDSIGGLWTSRFERIE